MIGDNVNWMETMHDESKDTHIHMELAIASCAVIQNTTFSDLYAVAPQNDLNIVSDDCAQILREEAVSMIPYFQQFKDFIKKPKAHPSTIKR